MIQEPRKARPVIDLFAGFGGFTTGLMQANYFPLRAFELEKNLASMYNKNLLPVCAEYGVHRVKWNLVLQHHRRSPGMVALVVGDCPFDPEDFRRAFHFFRAVREVSPLGFAFLTDLDFLSQEDVRIWQWRFKQRRILSDYRWGYQIVNYKDVGVPLDRKRALVFGVHESCKIEGFPKDTPLYMDFGTVELPTPEFVFDGIPYPRPYNLRSMKVSGHNSNWKCSKWNPQWPYDSRRRAGGMHHPYQKRRLTPREIMRVMGFPDTMFIFEVPNPNQI